MSSWIEFDVDAQRTVAYARATNDPIGEHLRGELAPPVFAILPVWDAVVAAMLTVTPAELLPLLVHGEQDIRIHRPIEPGMRLRSTAEIHGVRPKASGTAVVGRTRTETVDGEAVNEQYVVNFVRAPFADQPAGDDAPGHPFDETLRSNPSTLVAARVDADQTFRYAQASGDPMPIHLDDEVARAAGLPGIIAHGLCTMAFTSWALINAAGGDPRRLRRLAVRFSRPVLPGQEITTAIWPATRGRYQYETTSETGDVVVRNGYGEYREQA